MLHNSLLKYLENQQLARGMWIEVAQNDDISSKAAGRTPPTLLATHSGQTFDRECAAYVREKQLEQGGPEGCIGM